VNQHSENGREVYRQGDTISWIADVPGSTAKYLTVSNIGSTERKVQLPWQSLGMNAKTVNVRDLWAHKDLGSSNAFAMSLAPHATVLLKIAAQ
jgi:alpha-galactosidase